MSSDKLVCKGNKLFRNNGQSKDKNCQIVSKSNKNIDKSLFDFQFKNHEQQLETDNQQVTGTRTET